jgi:hypothetical protein
MGTFTFDCIRESAEGSGTLMSKAMTIQCAPLAHNCGRSSIIAGSGFLLPRENQFPPSAA